jgi:hypothetical protein
MTTNFTFAKRRFDEMKEARAKLLDKLAWLQAKLPTAKPPDRPILQSKIQLLQAEIREKELALSRFLDYNGPVGQFSSHRNIRPISNTTSEGGDGNDDDDIA